MHDPLERYLDTLRRAGLRFDVAIDLEREADHDGPLLGLEARRRHVDHRAAEIVEELDPEGGRGADHASFSVSRVLVRYADQILGRRFAEIGCGTGFLAVLAARLGADVVATDIDEHALELARRNAALNGVVIDARLGSLCDPLGDERLDWVVANLPHKPSGGRAGLPLSQGGGDEGHEVYARALPGLAGRQAVGGRLLFFLHSLPSPRLLLDVQRHYALELVSWKLRWLGADELAPWREHFRERHERATSYLHRDDGREALVACVWMGTRREDAR